jgi:hypothetical protein
MTGKRGLLRDRRIRAAAAGVLLGLAALWPATGQAGQRLTVVELFTSQGCPLCPPAEEYLGTLTRRADILPLAFHVDYWDYLGWRDRFAEPAFSRRQQRYSERLGLPYVYTPQIVVDGHLQASGGRPDDVEAEIATASADTAGRVEVTLTRLSSTRLRIALPASVLQGGAADIVLVAFDERHTTRVEGGENDGKTLVNHHVVRDVRSIAAWTGERFELTVPLDDDHGAPDFCAVLVQLSGQGHVIGAASIDMRVAVPVAAGKG